MKIKYNINESLTKKNELFFLPILMVFMLNFIPIQNIFAAEIEPLQSQKTTSEIYVAEGTFIFDENTTVIENENWYLAPGTIITGINHINIDTTRESPTAVKLKKKSTEQNNVLGVSKEFAPQQKTQDNTLKVHQERSNEKVQNTLFTPLSNPYFPTFEEANHGLGIVSSNNVNFNFGANLQTVSIKIGCSILLIDKQKFYTPFLFIENQTSSLFFLRGPPSPIFS